MFLHDFGMSCDGYKVGHTLIWVMPGSSTRSVSGLIMTSGASAMD